MSVRVETSPRFASGRPEELFAGPYELDVAGRGNYDIAPDGTRFVAVRNEDPTRDGSQPNRELRVILNWDEEMTRLVDAQD